ncbi:MAG: hypothetical protein COY86_05085 [Rhodobacterales bacterium CG_4_10_14_0_8_um_filter_70_9]|nr:MAG: hypothetical protein COY86_05085 [Rhodobacterales bacterium CG_4_10_14_0_8_um_filter_70_9]
MKSSGSGAPGAFSRNRRGFGAAPPEGMPPGTPFGLNIQVLLAHLRHSRHVGFERLAREMFGLSISEGAVANALHRPEAPLEAERDAIRTTLRAAEVVWSDETTTRINDRLHWRWVFVTPQAVLHKIAPHPASALTSPVLAVRHLPVGQCRRIRNGAAEAEVCPALWRAGHLAVIDGALALAPERVNDFETLDF